MSQTKTKISITVDIKALERVDELAAKRRLSRSEMITRMLLNGIDDEVKRVAVLESPFIGPLVDLVARPTVLRGLVKLSGEKMSKKELDEFIAQAQHLSESGKLLRAAKRNSGGEEGIAHQGV